MSIFASHEYASTRKSLARASTLPAWVYTSPDWYEREVETIFRRGWLMAAREDEIPDPGDYVRIDFFDEPLMVVRGRDGEIRTLSAACRHRGSELVVGSGNCRSFVCPYHGWTYSLSGELLSAPHMGLAEGFDVSECRLPEVRTETWGGFVAITFDDQALSLIESLGAFAERFESYRLEEMKLVRKWTYTVKCNWKLWAENSRETYHLAVGHRGSFERFRTGGYRHEIFNPHIEPKKFVVNSGPVGQASSASEKPFFPALETLTELDRGQVHYAFHYPHFILNLYPDKLVYHQLFPDGPESLTMSYTSCFPPSTIALPDFERKLEEDYYPAAEMAMAEDRAICEKQQRGLRGRLTAAGRYSPQEEATVHAFADYVLDRVLDNGA